MTRVFPKPKSKAHAYVRLFLSLLSVRRFPFLCTCGKASLARVSIVSFFSLRSVQFICCKYTQSVIVHSITITYIDFTVFPGRRIIALFLPPSLCRSHSFFESTNEPRATPRASAFIFRLRSIAERIVCSPCGQYSANIIAIVLLVRGY